MERSKTLPMETEFQMKDIPYRNRRTEQGTEAGRNQ